MVFFTVHFHQRALKVSTYLSKDLAENFDCCTIKDLIAVLGHKDQMYVHRKNAMPAVRNLLLVALDQV